MKSRWIRIIVVLTLIYGAIELTGVMGRAGGDAGLCGMQYVFAIQNCGVGMGTCQQGDSYCEAVNQAVQACYNTAEQNYWNCLLAQ